MESKKRPLHDEGYYDRMKYLTNLCDRVSIQALNKMKIYELPPALDNCNKLIKELSKKIKNIEDPYEIKIIDDTKSALIRAKKNIETSMECYFEYLVLFENENS